MKSKKTSRARKSDSRKYGLAAGKIVESAVRKQAITIGLSEARKTGAKVPKKTSD